MSVSIIQKCTLILMLAVIAGGIAGSVIAEQMGKPPMRVISLAPSITEILFVLEIEDRIVGVTRYCDYPEAAGEIIKVGGLVDPNYEEILALKPELVVLLDSHRDARRELEKMGLRTLSVPHETINDILEAIRLIGAACGIEKRAAGVITGLKHRQQAVARVVRDRRRPSVLMCIGRDLESGQLNGIYVAGRNNYFDEVIELAGGSNVYENEEIAYPQLSAEGVIQLDPEVIIDLVSRLGPAGPAPAEIAGQWQPLRTVRAVKNGRIHVIVGDHALRPGPRYVRFLEQLGPLMHPEAFEKEVHQ